MPVVVGTMHIIKKLSCNHHHKKISMRFDSPDVAVNQ
jgi:hypothetical protein